MLNITLRQVYLHYFYIYCSYYVFKYLNLLLIDSNLLELFMISCLNNHDCSGEGFYYKMSYVFEQ